MGLSPHVIAGYSVGLLWTNIQTEMMLCSGAFVTPSLTNKSARKVLLHKYMKNKCSFEAPRCVLAPAQYLVGLHIFEMKYENSKSTNEKFTQNTGKTISRSHWHCWKQNAQEEVRPC